MRPLTIILLVAIALMSGCSDSSAVSEDVRARYVEAEANRLCNIQKQSFPTQEEMERSFEEALTQAGITKSEKKALTKLSEKDEGFRQRISSRYKEVCK